MVSATLMNVAIDQAFQPVVVVVVEVVVVKLWIDQAFQPVVEMSLKIWMRAALVECKYSGDLALWYPKLW